MPKHGDVSDAGLVFWSYDSQGRERWMDPARYLFRKNVALRTSKRNYWKDPEKSRKLLRDYHHQNKPMKKASFERWASKNKERIRGTRLKRTYGIDNQTYEEMFRLQGGLCAICQRPQHGTKKTGESRLLCVDHCHKTGAVRKLLCTKCNAGIGQFEDNPETMMQAILYLKAHAITKQ